MRLVTAALAALALSAPAASHAQPVSTPAGAGPDTYLELHVGAFLPEHQDLDALDPGYDFGGTFGARFSPHVAVEAELSYVHATGTSSLPGASTEQRLAMVPFSASLRLRLPFKAGEVSALGGAGLYFSSLETTSTIVVPGASPSTTSDSSTTFGFHVGAAAGFNLSPTMVVGAEVRRTFVTGDFNGVDVGLDGVRLALTLGYHF
jgi:opacity protein-like surface antigen